jgi:hypothetical protein
MRCPSCNAAVEDGADLCLECGEPMGDSPAARIAREDSRRIFVGLTSPSSAEGSATPTLSGKRLPESTAATASGGTASSAATASSNAPATQLPTSGARSSLFTQSSPPSSSSPAPSSSPPAPSSDAPAGRFPPRRTHTPTLPGKLTARRPHLPDEPELVRCPGCGAPTRAARCPGCGTPLRRD